MLSVALTIAGSISAHDIHLYRLGLGVEGVVKCEAFIFLFYEIRSIGILVTVVATTLAVAGLIFVLGKYFNRLPMQSLS